MEITGVKRKVNRKIDNLAEARGMTRKEFEEWSDREQYKTEISDGEYLLIWAYQIDQAISRVENNDRAEALRREYWWINRFRGGFDDEIDAAVKHLTDVCAYIKKKYDRDYGYEWLLGFDDEFYFAVSKKKGKDKFKL